MTELKKVISILNKNAPAIMDLYRTGATIRKRLEQAERVVDGRVPELRRRAAYLLGGIDALNTITSQDMRLIEDYWTRKEVAGVIDAIIELLRDKHQTVMALAAGVIKE